MSGRLHIDIALGDGRAIAVARAGHVVQRATATLVWPPEPEDPTPAITTTLRALGDALGALLDRDVSGARVRIALLPPFSDARLVPLPPLRPAEAELVIRRDAARHFVGGNAPRVVAVLPAGGGVLAAAAMVHVVEAVHAATRAAGFTLERIVPAHGSWLAATRRVPGAELVVAVEGDTAHVLRLDNHRLTVARRVPAAWTDEVIAAAGLPGDATLFVPAAQRAPLTSALQAAGWKVADDGAATAAEAAAAWAMGSALEFVPPTLAAARQRQTRAMAVRMFVAALTLLVIAGVAELWGAKRELDAVRAERAAIRDDVAPLLAARDSLDELRQRASSVNDLHARAPRWTRALFDLALLLPEDAHITTLRTAGDTLLVEGTSGRAGDALQAMKKAGSLTDVRITGTVERELQDGETSVERFQMRAVITPMALPREAVKPAMPARAIREAALTEAARRRP